MIFSKKGQSNIMMDTIVVLIVAVVFGMVVFFGWQMFTELKTDMRADLDLNESKEVIDEIESRYPSVFDGLFIFIFMGLWAAGFVAGIMSEQHPALFGFMMLIMVFVLIVAAILGNYFEETFEDAELLAISSSFPMTMWVMTHLLTITIGVVVTIILGLMGKNKVT